MSTAEALCIKNTLTDQICLGRLISKHEMYGVLSPPKFELFICDTPF